MTRFELLLAAAQAVRDEFNFTEIFPTFELELNTDARFGDYSTNIAMVMGKVLGIAPRAMAEQLVPRLKTLEGVAKVEIAGPGFLNLTMGPEYWANSLDLKPRRTKEPLDKIQVEFISANPTGPMTLANARGGFVGDTIAAVLSESGNEVEREYYLNDFGGQVSKLADSVRAEQGNDIEGERQYKGEYIAELAAEVKDSDSATFERDLVEKVVADYLKPAVKRLGIEFDTWFSEASLAETGEAGEVLSILRSRGLIEEREGATWFLSEKLGDERDRVLVRSNGEQTYLLGDLSYHYNIYVKRGFTRSIKLWGADHAGQVKSLKLGVREIAPGAQIEFVLLQFVRLIKDGVEIKMSKRAGTYVTIDELLDMLEEGVGREHAVNVARWFFLSRSVDNRIDFDLELAREESQKNPYFYVMYSYARAQSLLANANEKKLSAKKPAAIMNDAELALVKAISGINDVVGAIHDDFGVQRLPHAAYELAKYFTALYEAERILDLPVPEAENRLYVVQSYIQALERIFGLMGVVPVKRMEAREE